MAKARVKSVVCESAHRTRLFDPTFLLPAVSLRERTRPGLGIIEPCLPSPAKVPPSGLGWIHEIKHDGFRIIARRDSAGVRLITRNGNDFTSRFPLAVDAVMRLPAHSFLLDGERPSLPAAVIARSNPRVSSRETRSLHAKVKTTATILRSAFYCQ